MWGRRSTCLGSADEKLVSSDFVSVRCSVLDFHCTFCVCGTWRRIGQASTGAFWNCTPCYRNNKHQSRRKPHEPQKKKSFQKRHIKWRMLGRPMNLRDCLWLVQQISWRCPVIFLSTLSAWCVCADTGVIWDSAVLSGCETVRDGPAISSRDTWVESARFQRESTARWGSRASTVRIMWTPLARRDREYTFCEDLITDDAGVVDPQLPLLAKVSS